MKRVLITNFFFERYTGSELHVLEMARLFSGKGYAVTIAVFRKGYPLLECTEDCFLGGAINVLEEELPYQDFDIVFAQHYPVLDYICCKYKIRYKKLIFSKLSVINELEYLPVCVNEADAILCVSEECANKVREEIGRDSRVKVFKNSVSNGFFDFADRRKENAELKRIAIISNHVPDELEEFSKVMKNEFIIDYIGVQHTPRFVDEKLLEQYDLVITIGRTVQQCFAMKVPVYVYDYFGGPGYITKNNFELAEKNNFSGRGFGCKSVEELCEDIVTNYEKHLCLLDWLNDIARKEYSYEVNFEKIYSELLGIDEQEWRFMEYYDGIAKKRILTYCKSVVSYAMPKKISSQLYFDCGNGYEEVTSIKWDVNENYVITRNFVLEKPVLEIRFDPCDVPAVCDIYSVSINGELKEEYSEKKLTFLNFDPQFIIRLTEEEKSENVSVQISYKIRAISWEETIQLYTGELKETDEKLREARCESEFLKKQNELIKEYYKLTPKNVIRRIKHFVKYRIFKQDRDKH